MSESFTSAFGELQTLSSERLRLLQEQAALLFRAGRFSEALSAASKIIEASPHSAEAFYNRAYFFYRTEDLAAALDDYSKAIALQPSYSFAFCNRGIIFKELGRFDEARRDYETALKIDPACIAAKLNLGQLELLLENFKEAFTLLEARPSLSAAEQRALGVTGARWNGTPLTNGQSLLIFCEQGIGDSIQMLRFVPAVAAIAPNFSLELPPELLPLAQTLVDASKLIPQGQTLPHAQFRCSLQSLPFLLGATLETISKQTAYLKVPINYIEKWKGRVLGASRKKIGLVWAGNPNYPDDYKRSMSFSDLEALLSLPYDFVSLQVHHPGEELSRAAKHENFLSLAAELRDFGDTAAVVSRLDMVVSVDTAVAHLSGALGKRLCLLLPASADARWLHIKSQSPWYPTAQIFRQSIPGKWSEPVGKVLNFISREFA